MIGRKILSVRITDDSHPKPDVFEYDFPRFVRSDNFDLEPA